MNWLSDELRRTLLLRARRAIARAIGADGATRVSEPIPHPQSLIPGDLRAGAFVTLHVRGELRGCIGYPEPEFPLLEVIDQCAVSAAISDPRFPAVHAGEWLDLEIEISVLGPIERVADLSEIVVGRHGLIVEMGHRRGLLLPQVASERNWGVAEFASQASAKAGLPRDAWRTGASLCKFEAEVFGEIDYGNRRPGD